MRWYEYLLVIVMIVVSNLITYYFTLSKPVYVIDMQRIVFQALNEEELKQVYESKMPLAEFMARKQEQFNKIEEYLKNYDIVYIKQAVYGRNVIDITDEVSKQVKLK